MIKYLNEAIDPAWTKRIKENNPNAYAILYGWQYKNEPEVEITPEVYMDKASLDRRLNQIVKDYSVYSQISLRGNRYAKESDILFYILYPSSLGESKNNAVTSSKVGYRNHEYYGANETGLDSIIRYEIGELGNSDIIDTVLDTFETNIEEKHILEAALDIIENEEYLGDTALDLVVKTLLNIIWKKYPNAKYGLWLCETPDAVERWYDGNKDNILTYRIENEQPISDLGFNDQGCLFVYDKPTGNYNITNQSLIEETESSNDSNKNNKLYKLDDITRRQVQRNPLYSKYRVEVVELEPLVTQLMKNTSILARRADNWGDSFDKFHIKSNKAYWYNDPIRLVKSSDGGYKVLDGNHRLIALYNDGWKQVECLVKDIDAIKEAYHFGNLEYGRKADKRGIMAGRGTGHFGTGFYTIGSVTDDTDYNGRELWELDLTKYNLFKPRNNNAGYTLHDTLKKLNGLFYRYKYNGYTPNMFKLKPYDLRIKLDDFEYEYGNEGIIKFIDSYFPAYREDIDHEINMGKWGAAEQVAYDSIEDFEDFTDDLSFVVNQLELIFPKEIGNVENIIWSLIKDNELDDQDNIDSISTLFIKKMGYEGVDVTHLNRAEDGLSGLDNFSYGSIVYDLKPGTYRKIRDKKEKKINK